jgi:hypothetical protein
MRNRILAGVLGAAALCVSSQVCAGPVTAHNPQDLVSALQADGFQADLGKDDEGKPQIITSTGGHKIVLSFSGCTANADCDYLELISYWTCTTEQAPKCDAAVAGWQKDEHMASLLRTKDGVAVYYYLIFTDGSLDDKMLVATLQYFARDSLAWQEGI